MNAEDAEPARDRRGGHGRGRRRGAARSGPRRGSATSCRGTCSCPFHYGYWDDPGRPRAANELTLPSWDPVSKQPHFKYAAARASKAGLLDKVGDAAGSVVAGVRAAAEAVGEAVHAVSAAASDRKVDDYLGMALRSEEELADAFESVGHRHRAEPDMEVTCRRLAAWSRSHAEALGPVVVRYSASRQGEPRRLAAALFQGTRSGGLGLLRDLHDLWLMANESHISWEVLHQVALGLRDEELKAICGRSSKQNDRQIAWLRTRIDQVAPQALIVPS